MKAITPFKVIYEQISTQCYPNLTHDGILGRANEALNFQVLFNPFEK